MLSKRFGENLFDEMFDDPFELMPMFSRHNPLYGKHAKALMKTDVREKDNSYELDIDLPGFKKDEIQAQISDGYLTISASKALIRTRKTTRAGISAASGIAENAAGASILVMALPRKMFPLNSRTVF